MINVKSQRDLTIFTFQWDNFKKCVYINVLDEKVIYLDPHICQPTTNVYPTNDKSNNANSSQMQTSLDESTFNSFQSSELFDNSSFHCASPSKLAFSKLDPSIAIGFYCKSRDEFNEFCDFIKKVYEFIDPIIKHCSPHG